MVLNLQNIDAAFFNFINHQLQNSFFDWLLPLVTYVGSGAAIWLILAFILYFFVPMSGRKTAVLMLFALLLSTLLANEIIKHLIARPRPFLTLPDVRLLIKEPLSYSFPSGHATTSFACAVIIAKKIKPLAPLVLFMAVTIAFSRVYVGVHYPLDIIVGGIIGCLCALLILRFEKILNFLPRDKGSRYQQ